MNEQSALSAEEHARVFREEILPVYRLSEKQASKNLGPSFLPVSRARVKVAYPGLLWPSWMEMRLP